MQVETNYETVLVMNFGSDCKPVRRAGHELKLLLDSQTGFGPPFDWANPQDCVSLYPTPADQLNLAKMSRLRHINNFAIGFFNHGEGITAALGARALGATVIEESRNNCIAVRGGLISPVVR
jgi:hypothetical protein